MWESTEPENIYSGRFRYYILIWTKSIKELHPEGRSRETSKYDAYIFNPWTGEFLEKRKMKNIREWEKYSGGSYGLMPDDEK